MASDSIEVIMPQMGESITEATITAWRKKLGETVEEGEALLDISTAKVEVEIPSPGRGVLAQILFREGETVPVDTVIALVAPEGADLSEVVYNRPDTAKPAAAPKLTAPATEKPAEPAASADPAALDQEREREHLIKRRSTPLVRNIANDLGISLDDVAGTGIHGRVTKRDIEAYLAEARNAEKSGGVPVLPTIPVEERKPSKLRPGDTKVHSPAPPIPVVSQPEEVAVSTMRRAIADNLVRSSKTIPHAFTIHEVDFTHLEKLRIRYKPVFEQQFNTRLTPLVFLLSAAADALLRWPAINASWLGDRIHRHKTVNIGVAVAVRDGLLVPVLRNVESMSLASIARGLVDLAVRARSNQLKPQDMEGGTFSITSPGQLGAAFAIPIINPPQGAILHFGAIQKVPAVVPGPDGEDCIAIRQRAMLTLGIDHRLVDGWEADQFMLAIKERIQRADFGLPS